MNGATHERAVATPSVLLLLPPCWTQPAQVRPSSVKANRHGGRRLSNDVAALGIAWDAPHEASLARSRPPADIVDIIDVSQSTSCCRRSGAQRSARRSTPNSALATSHGKRGGTGEGGGGGNVSQPARIQRRPAATRREPTSAAPTRPGRKDIACARPDVGCGSAQRGSTC